MFINYFIYFHIGVCILLIIVEMFWYNYTKIRDKIVQFKVKKYISEINMQICNAKNEGSFNKEYIKKLKKELKKTYNLLAFEKAYISLDIHKILFEKELIKIMRHLADYYKTNKNNTEKAYFAYLLGEFFSNINSKRNQAFFIEILYKWLNSNYTYLRINSLNSIFKIGNISNVIRAINIVNQKNYQYSNELLANTFINNNLNKEIFAYELIENFDDYNSNIQIAIIKFLSRYHYVDDNQVIEKLKSNYIYIDVKCEILRYFQNNKNKKLKEYLIELLSKETIVANDLIIKAIGTLGYYDENEVYELLDYLTYSKNALIREAAYKSLEKRENKITLSFFEMV